MHLDKSLSALDLECGKQIRHLTVAYETYGQLNRDASNVILVCHALSGDAHAAGTADNSPDILAEVPLLAKMKSGYAGWWDGMIGPGKTFDTNLYYVICTNILGSCYGTTGPRSIDPDTGKMYGADFPMITVRDMVKLQHRFLSQLGIKKLAVVTGGSLGGMQALEWAIMFPEMVQAVIPIATAARHSDWCIGINHLSRQAIMNDPLWQNGRYTGQPRAGLALARQIAMISYRTDRIFNQRYQGSRIIPDGNPLEISNIFQVESYLNYQGEKLVNRFDANTYMILSRALDSHDVGRDRGGVSAALSRITAHVLNIGIDSDILYPAHEQRTIAQAIRGARYSEISSVFGHDAFLVEFDQLDRIITSFIKDIA